MWCLISYQKKTENRRSGTQFVQAALNNELDWLFKYFRLKSEILRQPCYVNAEKWQPTEHEASNDDSYRLGSLGFHLKFSNLEN